MCRRGLVAMVAGVVLVFVAGCAPIPTPTPIPSAYQQQAITQPSGNYYELREEGPRAITISAPATNNDGNVRMAYWPTGQIPAENAEVCQTINTDSQPMNQEGVALRVTGDRAVVVQKKIFPLDPTHWQVIVWQSGNGTLVGEVDLSVVLGAYPWHVCARTSGGTVAFVVWTGGLRPAYGDTSHGGVVGIPDYTGNNGWYAGHLNAGDRMSYTDLAVG